MKRAALPLSIVVVVLATATVVYAAARGLFDRPAPDPTPPAPAPAAAAPAASAAVPAEDLRAAGLSPVRPGTSIIDFELQDLKGRKVKLSSFAGKVVFLNFWATWCPPCRAEMPSMERLHARLRDKGLVVLGVDLQEGKSEVEAFVHENFLTFPVVLDSSGSAGAAYGVRSIPTTFIIGRDGTILAGRMGAQEWDDPRVAALLERLLAR